MADVKRIYPEAKTALINWIEEHFHEIESYVFTCVMSDGTTMTVHDVDTFVEALGLLSVANNTICAARHDGEFKTKRG